MTDKNEKPKSTPETKENESDPQEHMEGPISSIMQNIKETGEENDEVTKEEADKEKDEKM